MEKLMSLFVFVVLSFGVFAQASESDKMCKFIDGRSSNNPTMKNNAMADLANIAKVLMDIAELEKSALDQKMTFIQFQELVRTKKKIKKVEVPDSYEAKYNSGYVQKYCGPAKTEAITLTVNGKTIVDGVTKVYTNQFDPSDHAYYKQLQK